MQAMDTKTNSKAVYFKLLGVLLREECSITVLKELKNNDIFNELPYEPQHSLVINGQQMILEWLNSAPEQELAEMAYTDYMKLFIGPSKLLAPPWGSCYISRDNLLFQLETLEVRQFYERHGLMIENKYNEPDDHLGLELIFLSYLAEEDEIDVMNDFIKRYILTWVDRWHSDVMRNAETDFYKGLANMILGGLIENTQ